MPHRPLAAPEEKCLHMITSLRSATRWVGSHLTDLAYPRTCAVCGQRGVWLCELCEQDFTPLVPGLCCDRCGHPNLGGHCACRSMHPAVIRARAMAVYDGWVAHAVKAVKYDRERDRAGFLAERMIPALYDLGQAHILIPVPLHLRRREWRGFNQAEVIAQSLAQETGMLMEHALVRSRDTDTQTHSDYDDRVVNVRGAFALTPGWHADPTNHYVLIDDVYTTGATISACAEVLEAAGVVELSVLTVAFDLQPRDLDAYRQVVSARSGR